MVDLQNEKKTSHDALWLVIVVLFAALAVILVIMVDLLNRLSETERSIDGMRSTISYYGAELKEVMQLDLDEDGFVGSPDRGPEQQPVQENSSATNGTVPEIMPCDEDYLDTCRPPR